MSDKPQHKQHEGVQESRQDQQQDEVARSRPAQHDQQVHDAHSKRPPRKDGDAGSA